jgi:hypothetical protein
MLAAGTLSMKYKRHIGAMLLLVAAVGALAADKFAWKAVEGALVRIDDRAPKQWGLYHSGKKYDPLLLQLGVRVLVIYVRNQAVYELPPAKVEHKGEDLIWRESDKPEKPLATTDWTLRDVGSAQRIVVKLSEEGRMLDIQVPQMPDLRGLY